MDCGLIGNDWGASVGGKGSVVTHRWSKYVRDAQYLCGHIYIRRIVCVFACACACTAS